MVMIATFRPDLRCETGHYDEGGHNWWIEWSLAHAVIDRLYIRWRAYETGPRFSSKLTQAVAVRGETKACRTKCITMFERVQLYRPSGCDARGYTKRLRKQEKTAAFHQLGMSLTLQLMPLDPLAVTLLYCPALAMLLRMVSHFPLCHHQMGTYFPGYLTGGFDWMPNLSAPDPTWTLPILTSASLMVCV